MMSPATEGTRRGVPLRPATIPAEVVLHPLTDDALKRVRRANRARPGGIAGIPQIVLCAADAIFGGGGYPIGFDGLRRVWTFGSEHWHCEVRVCRGGRARRAVFRAWHRMDGAPPFGPHSVERRMVLVDVKKH